MIIYPKELINEYYHEIKDKYPNLSFNDIDSIIRASWSYIRKCIEYGDIISVRIKYFGSFVIYKSRLKAALDIINKNSRKLSDEEVLLKKQKIINMINDNKYFETKVNLHQVKSGNRVNFFAKLEYDSNEILKIEPPCKCISYIVRKDRIDFIYKVENIPTTYKDIEKEIVIFYKNGTTHIIVVKAKISKI